MHTRNTATAAPDKHRREENEKHPRARESAPPNGSSSDAPSKDAREPSPHRDVDGWE